MTPETPILPASFFDPLLSLELGQRVRWYMCAIVSSSSFNYPDVIPQIYKHFDSQLLSSVSAAERFPAVQKVREGLIKSTGIVGAARAGNAMRTLGQCIPEELREKDSPRSKESDEVARERGHKFWRNIYARNEAFDPEASVRASPDYAFVVRDVLYARVFSFDGVLDPLTTGYAIVSGLYGMDCQNQLQHHMKGMLYNGASQQDLEQLQQLCLGMAKALGVQLRHGPAPIPVIT